MRHRPGPPAGRAIAASFALLLLWEAAVGSAFGQGPLYLVDGPFSSNKTLIYEVEASTGAVTLRADLGTAYTPVFGLAAAGGQVLYAVGTDNTPAQACGPGAACLLLRILLDPEPGVPPLVEEIGHVQDANGVVAGITGLTFDEQGSLLAASQDTDDLWSVDPQTAAATRIGPFGLDFYGADVTTDDVGRLWIWTNAEGFQGLYEVDRVSGAAAAFDVHPGLNFAGMASIAHGSDFRGAHPPSDRLHNLNPLYGVSGGNVLMTLDGIRFDHTRGDLDSPWCAADASCDDGDPCTIDLCAANGCRHEYPEACCGTDDPDGDGVAGLCDNCPEAPNAAQADRDGDARGDACDEDADGDGSLDVIDCAPGDPSAAFPPIEVTGVAVEMEESPELEWDDQGPGFRYDLVSGMLSILRASGGTATPVCLSNNLPTPEAVDSRPGPPQDEAFYYLVRAQNRCGGGDFGAASDGSPRAAACP